MRPSGCSTMDGEGKGELLESQYSISSPGWIWLRSNQLHFSPDAHWSPYSSGRSADEEKRGQASAEPPTGCSHLFLTLRFLPNLNTGALRGRRHLVLMLWSLWLKIGQTDKLTRPPIWWPKCACPHRLTGLIIWSPGGGDVWGRLWNYEGTKLSGLCLELPTRIRSFLPLVAFIRVFLSQQ